MGRDIGGGCAWWKWPQLKLMPTCSCFKRVTSYLDIIMGEITVPPQKCTHFSCYFSFSVVFWQCSFLVTLLWQSHHVYWSEWPVTQILWSAKSVLSKVFFDLAKYSSLDKTRQVHPNKRCTEHLRLFTFRRKREKTQQWRVINHLPTEKWKKNDVYRGFSIIFAYSECCRKDIDLVTNSYTPPSPKAHF